MNYKRETNKYNIKMLSFTSIYIYIYGYIKQDNTFNNLIITRVGKLRLPCIDEGVEIDFILRTLFEI